MHAILAFVLLSPLGTGTSEAKNTRAPTLDSIIFVRDNSLWSTPIAGDKTIKLLDFPWLVENYELLHIAANGSALLIQMDGLVAWSKLDPATQSAQALKLLPCGGPARLSSDGASVTCRTQDKERIAIYTMLPTISVRVIDKKVETELFWSGNAVLFRDTGGLVKLQEDSESKVSNHAPSSNMQVTPKGDRVIGSYQEGDIDVVYTFKLDGKAVKRTLVQAGRVVSISADSTWAAIQQEIDACAVRVAGGQYMCWTRFEAVDISTEGRNLLLSVAGAKVGHDLYLGSVSGTKASKPNLIAEGVGTLAAFWRP